MRRAEDYIPADVLAAAKAAGLKAPLWYAGRRGGQPRDPGPSPDDLVMDGRRKAGLCTECYHPHPVSEPCDPEGHDG